MPTKNHKAKNLHAKWIREKYRAISQYEDELDKLDVEKWNLEPKLWVIATKIVGVFAVILFMYLSFTRLSITLIILCSVFGFFIMWLIIAPILFYIMLDSKPYKNRIKKIEGKRNSLKENHNYAVYLRNIDR